MKKIQRAAIILITIIVLFIGLFIKESGFTNMTKQEVEGCEVVIVEDESFLSDFEVIDNEVHIYCEISLKNNNSDSKEVKLIGNFQKEVDNGLLIEDNLEAYFIEEAADSIVVEGDSNIRNVKVEFVGEYGGNPAMSNRMLPCIEVIEKMMYKKGREI